MTRIPDSPVFTTATASHPSSRIWDYSFDWTSESYATRYELWGPDSTRLHSQVRIYNGSSTNFEHGIFSYDDEPTVGFKVRACNSVGCSSYRSVNP